MMDILVLEFKRGTSVTDGTVIRFWRKDNEKFEMEIISNGGGDKAIVDHLPLQIEGFHKTFSI